MTRSNLVACSTGRAGGLAPLRSLSTRYAARRYISTRLGPWDMRPPLRPSRDSTDSVQVSFETDPGIPVAPHPAQWPVSGFSSPCGRSPDRRTTHVGGLGSRLYHRLQ